MRFPLAAFSNTVRRWGTCGKRYCEPHFTEMSEIEIIMGFQEMSHRRNIVGSANSLLT